MPDSPLITAWEFCVKSDCCLQFESVYGPDGEWAQLFRRSPDYLGTTLLRDADHPGRYLTLDHWKSRESIEHFKRDYHADYAALDQRCEGFTDRETLLGDFEPVASHSGAK